MSIYISIYKYYFGESLVVEPPRRFDNNIKIFISIQFSLVIKIIFLTIKEQ